MKLRSIVFVLLAFFTAMSSHALSFKDFLEERIRSTVVEKTFKSLGGVSNSTAEEVEENQNNETNLRGFEKNKEWQDIFQMFYVATQKVNEGIISSGQSLEACSSQVVEYMYLSERDFNRDFNVNLVKQVSSPSKVLDVSSFGDLSKVNTNNYLEAKPFSIPNVSAINYLMFKNDNKNSSIYKNASSIMIPIRFKDAIDEQFVVVGRSVQSDAKDLYTATLRDMSNIGFLIVKNPKFGINFEDYVKSVLNLYARNKVMCLYDVNP
jgi:hypothetical protein